MASYENSQAYQNAVKKYNVIQEAKASGAYQNIKAPVYHGSAYEETLKKGVVTPSYAVQFTAPMVAPRPTTTQQNTTAGANVASPGVWKAILGQMTEENLTRDVANPQLVLSQLKAMEGNRETAPAPAPELAPPPQLTLAQVQSQYEKAAADLEAYKKARASGPGRGEYQMDIDRTIYEMENRADFLKNKLDQMKSQQITDKDMAEIEKLPPEARKQLEALVNWDSTASYYDAFSNGEVNSAFLLDKAKVQQQAWDSLQKMGYSREKIDQYVSSLSRATNARNAEAMASSAKELADNHGFVGSLMSVAANAGAGLAGTLEAGATAVKRMMGNWDGRYQTDDPNKPGFAPGMFTEGVRGEVSENIKEKHPGAGGKALDALYRASMSAADNLIRAAAAPGGKAFTLGLMGTGSFQDSYRGATARGASPEKAMLMGVVDAAIEEFTEKFSLDRLLDDSITVDSLGKLVKSALTQGGVEASEEELGFVLNLLSDSLIMGNKSEVRTNINEMVAGGATYAEAEKTALRQTLMQALDTGVTSALSGGMMDAGRRFKGAAAGTAQRIHDQINQHFQETAPRPLGPVREDVQGKKPAFSAPIGENVQTKKPVSEITHPVREDVKKPSAGDTMTANIYNGVISDLQAEYDAVTDKNSAEAKNILDRIHTLKSELASVTGVVRGDIQKNTVAPDGTTVTVRSANSALTEENKAKRTVAYTLASNIDSVRDMQPVSNLTGTEFKKLKGVSLPDQIKGFFKSFENKVFRNGFGDVELSEYGVGGIMNHRPLNRARFVSLAAVPDVIKSGRQIDYVSNWKGRGYETYTFAAPVTVNGTQVYVAAVVNKNPGSKFYLSEMVDSQGNYVRIEESPSGSSKFGATDGAENPSRAGAPMGPEGLSEESIPSAANAEPTSLPTDIVPPKNAEVNHNLGSSRENVTPQNPQATSRVDAAGMNAATGGQRGNSAEATITNAMAAMENGIFTEKMLTHVMEDSAAVSLLRDQYGLNQNGTESENRRAAAQLLEDIFFKRVDAPDFDKANHTDPILMPPLTGKQTQPDPVQPNAAPAAGKDTPIQTVKERLQAKLGNSNTELENVRAARENSNASYDRTIDSLQEKYDSKKNKDTKAANDILRRIESLKRQKADRDADYAKRISDIEKRIGKTTAEMQKDHTRADNLERAYARIEKQTEQEKAALAEEFSKRKAEAEAEIKDKPAFVSKKAKELYDEVRGMEKGKRVSGELGYLLDHLDLDAENKADSYRQLKTALLNIVDNPSQKVDQRSSIEETARNMLNDVFEDMAYEVDQLDTEYENQIKGLDEEARKRKADARKDDERVHRKELHAGIVENIRKRVGEVGIDLDEALDKANRLSTFSTNDLTPQRVIEKTFGRVTGGIINDLTVNKVAQDDAAGTKWLNSHTGKGGTLEQLSQKYNITPGSKENAAAQMYGEGFYVAKDGSRIRYGDAELAQDFPDPKVQDNIKGLARDPIVRQVYDETLDRINESRTRNGYEPISKRANYFLHFQEASDIFSQLGMPFNMETLKAKDLPTDLNGMTADLKPGQPYFSSAKQRMGDRTTYDLLGGMEKYLRSAKGQIYQIDNIQTLRALRNYIAERYGQAHGLENLDSMSFEEQEQRIKEVYNGHLSNFAKFLNEEANVIAGKTSVIDRSVEGLIGRRALQTLNTINSQVGKNLVGYNITSPFTNFLSVFQAGARINKVDLLKGFAQTVQNRFAGIFGKTDGFVENNPTLISRKGEETFSQKPMEKVGNFGYTLMGFTDDIASEIIVRSKYNELTRTVKIGDQVFKQGMDPETANIRAGEWASRLMGDRAIGQVPLVFNSKTLGLITKFQLEARNSLDASFYDVIQEADASTELIKNGLARNAVKAAKITAVEVELAVFSHLFNEGFEKIFGYNPALDIINVFRTLIGADDDEDSEDTPLDNLGQAALVLLEGLPYGNFFTGGGRLPVSNAIPFRELFTGKDQYGRPQNRFETMAKAAPYYFMPGGYGQIQKGYRGLKMFLTDEDHPIAGAYTQSGNLKYPVEDNWQNMVKAGLLGANANQNAQDYNEGGRTPLPPDQVKVFQALDEPIQDYWKFQDNLSRFHDIEKQADEAADKTDATDKDEIKKSYIHSFSNEIDLLVKDQKKVLESDASEEEKRKQVQELQHQIDDLIKAGREEIKDFTHSSNYAKVGDREFIKNSKGEWTKASDSQLTAQTRGKEVLGLEPGAYWDVRNEVSAKADAEGASPGDRLQGQFINGIVKHINDLYYDIEDIEASDMPEWEKQSKIIDIQDELKRYGAKTKPYFRSDLDVRITGGNVATIGNGKYYKDSNGSWAPMSNSQDLRAKKTAKAFGISESQYWAKKKEYDFAYSNIDTYNKMMEYGISFQEYSRGGDDLARLISKDPSVYEEISDYIYNLDAKDDTLHTQNGLKKQKVTDYIWNELKVDDGIKMILYKQQYPNEHKYDHDIAVYLTNRPDVSRSQMKNILLGLGALVDQNGSIKWKW